MNINYKEIDKEMRGLIRILNKVGLKSYFCCSGHGSGSGYICFDENNIFFFEDISVFLFICKNKKLLSKVSKEFKKLRIDVIFRHRGNNLYECQFKSKLELSYHRGFSSSLNKFTFSLYWVRVSTKKEKHKRKKIFKAKRDSLNGELKKDGFCRTYKKKVSSLDCALRLFRGAPCLDRCEGDFYSPCSRFVFSNTEARQEFLKELDL
ncbi:MAG: hypothetical protein GY679_01165 [Mycoplasma sp.]|nr:hypothetical protein [Mycoplasma sp.]